MTSHIYKCTDCGIPVEYKREPNRGHDPLCFNCRKRRTNKAYEARKKAEKQVRPPAQKGDGVHFLGSKKIPHRIEELCELFLQLRDRNGHEVKHSKREYRELAAQFHHYRAPWHAAFCERRAG
jgi:DNA-directed RNA polymerase subunit RPC12/RpoP